MQTYVGTKIIEAEFVAENVIETTDSNGDIKLRPSGYVVKYPDGYTSWSPQKAFEDAYRPINALTFGIAIESAKLGYKIARTGWNGKNQFVIYQKGYPQGISCNKQTAEAWGINEGDLFICNPYLQIQGVDGSHSMWVPSINDVLAEDWYIK